MPPPGGGGGGPAGPAGARAALVELVRQAPQQSGHEQSRWTLRSLMASGDWLRLSTPAGLWQLLDRRGLSSKRAREDVRSPDPDYDAKCAWIETCRQQALAEPERFSFRSLDEFGSSRQPTLARADEVRGHTQPLARRSWRRNTVFRGIGALNALTGQLTYAQHSHIDLRQLVRFWQQLCETDPNASGLFVVLDNWPLHFHPDVLAGLEPQRCPWPLPRPANWPTTPRPSAPRLHLPIQRLCLPTYAPWLNPIEQLWRWVRQQVIHLHRQADDWDRLKQRVADFMHRFCQPSPEWLRYVGLLPD